MRAAVRLSLPRHGARLMRLPCIRIAVKMLNETMSGNTIYSFIAWHGEALELMERQGFVICKKTM